jgi:hypothetical protein
MLRPAAFRHRMARTLNAAYGDGLLSNETLVHRLDALFGSRLIDPANLIGDLTLRAPRRTWRTAISRALRIVDSATPAQARDARAPGLILALDWTGAADELVIGRHPTCDVVLAGPAVSRRHARLRFRDGSWVLQDLDSTNGTWVNDVRVGRCQLHPGDQLELGDACLMVD